MVVRFIGYGGGRGAPSEHALLAALGYQVFVMDSRGQGGRWTTARKQRILDSRRSTTRALSGLLTALDGPPAVLLSGSAMGFYGDTGDREVDESSPSGSGFLPDVVRQWEAAAKFWGPTPVQQVIAWTADWVKRGGQSLGKPTHFETRDGKY